MEKLIRAIHSIHPLPSADLERLLDSGEEIRIPKGTALIREGEVSRSFYLLKSGVLRGYWTDEAREITIWFVVPGEPVFSSWGYLKDEPSEITISASSDCALLRFSQETMEGLFASSPDLGVWGRRMFGQLLLTTDKWLVEMTRPLARDRYISLIEQMPEILQSVPLKEIAGHLGMTPQSLSRIRAELAKGK